MAAGSAALIRTLVDLSTSAGSMPEYYGAAMQELARVVGCENAIVFSPRIVDGSPFVYGMCPEACSIVSTFLDDFEQYRTSPTRASELATRHEVITDQQLYANLGFDRDRDPFVCDILRPSGITSVLDMAVKVGGEVLGFVSLHRAGRSRPFSSRETELLMPVAPVLGLAVTALRARCQEPSLAWLKERLTPRELQIAALVRQGLSNKEIAGVLGSSPSTVRNQLHSMFEKLSISRRTELARMTGALQPAARDGSPRR